MEIYTELKNGHDSWFLALPFGASASSILLLNGTDHQNNVIQAFPLTGAKLHWNPKHTGLDQKQPHLQMKKGIPIYWKIGPFGRSTAGLLLCRMLWLVVYMSFHLPLMRGDASDLGLGLTFSSFFINCSTSF